MNVKVNTCEWSIDIYGVSIYTYDKVYVTWEWSLKNISMVSRSSNIFNDMWSMIYRI